MLSIKKARHYQNGKYDVLVGGVGSPEAIDIMTAAAIRQITVCSNRDWELGSMPSVMCFGNSDDFITARDMINSMYDKTKSPSDLLVMAKHFRNWQGLCWRDERQYTNPVGCGACTR